MTFGGDDLYPDIPAKAAAMMQSLALNHPFADGSKRVAAHAAVLFALVDGFECVATPDELVAMAVSVADGKIEVEALTIWFRQRLRAEPAPDSL
jgi:death-on-curing protein